MDVVNTCLEMNCETNDAVTRRMRPDVRKLHNVEVPAAGSAPLLLTVLYPNSGDDT